MLTVPSSPTTVTPVRRIEEERSSLYHERVKELTHTIERLRTELATSNENVVRLRSENDELQNEVETLTSKLKYNGVIVEQNVMKMTTAMNDSMTAIEEHNVRALEMKDEISRLKQTIREMTKRRNGQEPSRTVDTEDSKLPTVDDDDDDGIQGRADFFQHVLDKSLVQDDRSLALNDSFSARDQRTDDADDHDELLRAILQNDDDDSDAAWWLKWRYDASDHALERAMNDVKRAQTNATREERDSVWRRAFDDEPWRREEEALKTDINVTPPTEEEIMRAIRVYDDRMRKGLQVIRPPPNGTYFGHGKRWFEPNN